MTIGSPLQQALQDARSRRNRLAATIRSAQLELERSAAGRSVNPQTQHEREALQQALAALLEQLPTPEPDRELASLMRHLEREEAIA